MKPRTLIATGLPLLGFAGLGGLCFLLVTNPPMPQRFSVAVAVSASLLHTYALVMYMRGFRYFKQEMRIAYTLLSVGIALLGIAISQLTFVTLFDWDFWTDSGLLLIPYVVAVTTILMGIRRFGRNLGIQSKWLWLPAVGGVSIVVAAAAAFIPHVPTPAPELTHKVALALTALIATFFVASTRGAMLVRARAGSSYKDSLTWLVTALASAAVGACIYLLELLLSGAKGWYYDWSITILYFNLTGWLFLRAGYAFSVIGAPEQVDTKKVTSVDIILYVESLAANPSAIGFIADELRLITARIGPDGVVTPTDQANLLTIYYKLEDYLTTYEPLRKLDREEVRRAVERRFGVNESSKHTFWPMVRAIS